VTDAPAAVVVLAAGHGTRMRSSVPKVLHEIAGRSLLGHVLAAVEPLGADRTLVVVGHDRERVTEHLAALSPEATPVVQDEQLGTGHAAALALATLPDDVDGTVVVVPGDTPLLRTATLQELLDRHAVTSAAATLLSAELADPTGYGRVVRDGDGQVAAIVEERDANEPTRALREVNTSVYAFDADALRGCLARIGSDNAQGEQYLTDVVGLLVADGRVVSGVRVDDADETLGVNDRVQLATAARLLRDRLVEAWLRDGAGIVDPATTWVDVGVRLASDCVIHPHTQLLGATSVAAFAEVGPDSTLVDTAVAERAEVVRSHCRQAVIGPDSDVGPYSYLRPGTRLGRGAKVGAYVETKNAEIGDGSKVPHLSYVGDATIGRGTNVGAATVFVNYDGVAKHHTTVGDEVRIGSDTMLVAPVEVGDGAYTAAGSVVTDDVPPGALAVGRARQRTIPGWTARRRPGTASAEAAARATESSDTGTDLDTGTMESSADAEPGREST
jgi:bifunctional UDP-N-acetylglucosamine pyrophosphorylase / glucosamine-1-phosphate N-acetyltransferase